MLVKPEHENRISHVGMSSVKTGIANTLGNSNIYSVTGWNLTIDATNVLTAQMNKILYYFCYSSQHFVFFVILMLKQSISRDHDGVFFFIPFIHFHVFVAFFRECFENCLVLCSYNVLV